MSTKPTAKFGIVFDIDGVLMKSDRAIPEAAGALNLLHDHEECVPRQF